MRARPIAIAAVLLVSALAPAAARADEEEVYLTRAEALREVFEDGERFEEADLRPTAGERARIEKRLGSRLFEESFTVVRALGEDGALQGYAIVTEEIGKFKPITFLVAIAPDASVKDVAVMVYRESHGGDVRRRRFLAQFRGKTTEDPIKQNRDIINITGATLSVRSVARGVRKVLLVVEELLLGERRRTDLAWHPLALEGEKAGTGGGRKSSDADAAPLRRARYRMGTLLEAVAYGPRAPAAAGLSAAFDEVARLERLLSTFIPESELSRVNREGAGRAVPVSEDTYACVAAALEFARRSGGAFDPTRAPGGYRDVRLDPAGRTIRFARPGLALDLGGIGKGFALDRAAAVLERAGVRRAAFDFGGQVLALDPPPGAAGWLVAVRDPARESEALGGFEIARASVSTSGQYERPGHIVDPRTGRAAAAGVVQATVVAPSATAADALSTAVFVLGPEAGLALARAEPGAAVVIVPAAGGGGARPIVAAPAFVAFEDAGP